MCSRPPVYMSLPHRFDSEETNACNDKTLDIFKAYIVFVNYINIIE